MDRPKKILYVITKSNFGGAQRYVFDLAAAMKESGFDVAVALGGEGVLKQKLDAKGVRTISISTLGRDLSVAKDTASLKTLYSIIKTERPDILHLNSPKAAGLGALGGRLLGIKDIIQTVHGFSFNENRPLWQRALICFFSWLTILLCHKTIVLSERELNQTKRMLFVENKIILIRNGVHAISLLSREEARKDLGIPENAFVVGSVGELHKNKGFEYLVEAAHLLPNITFCVIGEGEERKTLESRIKELGFAERFKLPGFLENAAQYQKAFDIFVLPSVKEGLPYVLLEAGLASLPVVATNVGGIPEIIEDKNSGLLVQPKNPRELAEAISFLIKQPKHRVAFGEELRTRVASQFTLKHMLSQTERLY